MSRAIRKQEHIHHAITTGQKGNHGFEDIQFVHQSLPNSDYHCIDMTTEIGELPLCSPIFINAMTGGGGEKTKNINQQLAEVANEAKIAMAVGSQMAAIKDEKEQETYKIVRKSNPKGTLIANLGSEATVDQAKRAVQMIEANALQIHLNVVQELVMPEGDRTFTNALQRIEAIVKESDVPVIVKEVGFGMSKEAATQLANVGVTVVDVGGFGGTNFSKIENLRRKKQLDYFNEWGITTTASIVEVKKSQPDLSVIASGGLTNSLDGVKSLALGASALGFAGYFLQILLQSGQEGLLEAIIELLDDMKILMTALGCPNITSLQQTPLVISGNTYHWLEQRGCDPKGYSEK
ncbi:type 2 isopentenyl-diphosphate Delta-isomerase [Alkalihalobacterium bogoriense]|uniref:type 2 isopentenyl-diphosphate Delta-isomerase n=1 Tax=Alkalihalobacterium bogoriense TaxID=246272 RepID=UPI00047ABBF2|nr:type 2 isopentenyl-diphosphate Delta-isomerase [Alkalihalobacterium bogoriense]